MATQLPSMDICALGRFRMMPRWGESFFHEGFQLATSDSYRRKG